MTHPRYRAPLLGLLLVLLAACSGGGSDDSAQRKVLSGGPVSAIVGTSVVTFTSPLDAQSVQPTATGYRVTSKENPLDMIELSSTVSQLVFSDYNLALGQTDTEFTYVFRLYQAAFNRKPDPGGLGYWVNVARQGAPIRNIARDFISSAEFRTLYGDSPTHQAFLEKLYWNVLQRLPDQAGLDYWLNALNTGVSREHVLYEFSDSAENRALTKSAIDAGIVYIPTGDLVNLSGATVPSIKLNTTSSAVAFGSPVDLAWSGSNAAYCVGVDDWQGGLPFTGNAQALPENIGQRYFGVRCVNDAGSMVSRVNVKVVASNKPASHASCLSEYYGQTAALLGRTSNAFSPNGGEAALLGEYIVSNGGGQSATCMSSDFLGDGLLRSVISWDLPPQTGPKRPVTYQEITFGRSPWRPAGDSTSATMPVAVTTVPATLNVAFDMSIEASGSFNTLFDLWIGNSGDAHVSHTTELMIIHASLGNDPSLHAGEPTVVINGIEYWVPVPSPKIRPHPDFPSDPTSYQQGIQFTSTKPVYATTMPIKPFLDYLLAQGWIEPTDYLLNISFGVEPNEGKGRLQLKSYKINQ